MKRISGICLITEYVCKLAEFYQTVLQTKADLNDVMLCCRSKAVA